MRDMRHLTMSDLFLFRLFGTDEEKEIAKKEIEHRNTTEEHEEE